MRRLTTTSLAVGAALLGLAGGLRAYDTFAAWPDNSAVFYINPANADNALQAGRTNADVVAALQTGMDAWNSQSGSSFRYSYGGLVSDTATSLDNRNVIMFRNASSGSAIASTYSWWNSSNQLLDSDIVFWDAGFAYYTGSTLCGTTAANPAVQSVSNSAYIEDVATHELGHALGLNHSSDPAATMYPSYSYCSKEMRTLGSDDIAGARALYSSAAPVNTAPSISITSPSNGANYAEGSSVTFTGSAADNQDGSLTGAIQWTDNGASVGSGGAFTRTLTVGSHSVVAYVFDSGGLQTSRSVSVTVTATVSGTNPASTPTDPTARKGGGRKARR